MQEIQVQVNQSQLHHNVKKEQQVVQHVADVLAQVVKHIHIRVHVESQVVLHVHLQQKVVLEDVLQFVDLLVHVDIVKLVLHAKLEQEVVQNVDVQLGEVGQDGQTFLVVQQVQEIALKQVAEQYIIKINRNDIFLFFLKKYHLLNFLIYFVIMN
jgi:hypothetical protein